MDIFIARQPILNRQMKVVGYELLHRLSEKNYFEGCDETQATAEVINHAFLTLSHKQLTNDKKAFINFSNDLIHQEIPHILPKETTVIEILEHVEVTDELISCVKMLREKGYTIALDDFYLDESFLPLLEIVHIVKIEIAHMPLEMQKAIMEKYKHRIQFVAEKVETCEEYEMAYNMGYDYFQGYFFSKPTVIKGTDLDHVTFNYCEILAELEKENINFQKLADIIQADAGITLKFLRLANSVLNCATSSITSLKHLLIQLGATEIKKWLYILMQNHTETSENQNQLLANF